MTHHTEAQTILDPDTLRQLTEAGLVVLPADTPRSLPTGVTIADDATGHLRHESEWIVLEDGVPRRLRLSLARGVIR